MSDGEEVRSKPGTEAAPPRTKTQGPEIYIMTTLRSVFRISLVGSILFAMVDGQVNFFWWISIIMIHVLFTELFYGLTKKRAMRDPLYACTMALSTLCFIFCVCLGGEVPKDIRYARRIAQTFTFAVAAVGIIFARYFWAVSPLRTAKNKLSA